MREAVASNKSTPAKILTHLSSDKERLVRRAAAGNSVPHLHAHLIPRYPNREVFPGSSPWNDPRRLSVLPDKEVEGLVARILERL